MSLHEMLGLFPTPIAPQTMARAVATMRQMQPNLAVKVGQHRRRRRGLRPKW